MEETNWESVTKEQVRIDLPYNKTTNPPYLLDILRMIKRTRKKLDQWLNKLEKPFTSRDGLKLVLFDKQKEALYVQYEVVRDKY